VIGLSETSTRELDSRRCTALRRQRFPARSCGTDRQLRGQVDGFPEAHFVARARSGLTPPSPRVCSRPVGTSTGVRIECRSPIGDLSPGVLPVPDLEARSRPMSFSLTSGTASAQLRALWSRPSRSWHSGATVTHDFSRLQPDSAGSSLALRAVFRIAMRPIGVLSSLSDESGGNRPTALRSLLLATPPLAECSRPPPRALAGWSHGTRPRFSERRPGEA
jgi:hypothetical protein